MRALIVIGAVSLMAGLLSLFFAMCNLSGEGDERKGWK